MLGAREHPGTRPSLIALQLGETLRRKLERAQPLGVIEYLRGDDQLVGAGTCDERADLAAQLGRCANGRARQHRSQQGLFLRTEPLAVAWNGRLESRGPAGTQRNATNACCIELARSSASSSLSAANTLKPNMT